MKRAYRVMLLLGMLGVVVLILFPLLWGVLISMKTRVDALAMPPHWAFTPTLTNYRSAFVEGNAGRTLLNSLTIATASSVVAVCLALPAAYWLSRVGTSKRRSILVAAMTTRLAPATVLALPLFLAFARLHLIDTYIPVVLVHAGIAMAPAIWLLTVGLDQIPRSIDDASFLDGDSALSCLRRQIFPIALPLLVVTTSLAFVLSWNEFFLALMLTGYDTRPFTVAVSALMTPHGTNWGQVMAICSVAIVPGALLATFGARAVVNIGETIHK